MKHLCIPPKVPQQKTLVIKNNQQTLGESHAQTWSFGFWKTRKITGGSDGCLFSIFSTSSGGVLSQIPGEPPKTRHAENAAALLENVLGTQGSGWYGRAYCFTTMIRWWTTTWYSFSQWLLLAWLSLFWVVVVVVVVVFLRQTFSIIESKRVSILHQPERAIPSASSDFPYQDVSLMRHILQKEFGGYPFCAFAYVPP